MKTSGTQATKIKIGTKHVSVFHMYRTCEHLIPLYLTWHKERNVSVATSVHHTLLEKSRLLLI